MLRVVSKTKDGTDCGDMAGDLPGVAGIGAGGSFVD
jgi:hypothetical protein